jgi:hypothetical protein
LLLVVALAAVYMLVVLAAVAEQEAYLLQLECQ